MNQSAWSKGMYYSGSFCPDGCTAEHLSGFQPDPLVCVSLTSHKDSEEIKMLHEQAFYGSSDACSSHQEFNTSSDDVYGSTRWPSSPASSSLGHPELDYNSSHQAKRARVESIIKGMASSPGVQDTDVMTNQYEESDTMKGNERIQELPLHQGRKRPGCMSNNQMKIKKLDSQQQHRQQLRTGSDNVDAPNDNSDSGKEEKYPSWKDSSGSSSSYEFIDSYSEFQSSKSRKLQGWKKMKLLNYFQSKPDRIKLISDVLKYELSKAVSMSVDSIFKSMPLLQMPQSDRGNVETDIPLHPTVCKDNSLSCCGKTDVATPDVQTEALSLVVQKPQPERDDKFSLQSGSRGHRSPKPPVPLSQDPSVLQDEPSDEGPHAACQHALQHLPDEVDPVKFAMFNAHWNSIKVRSKVNSRSLIRPHSHTLTVNPRLLESLCLPHVKIESDSLVKNTLYMLNEGLTTSHLKKAKLMFFFTRYPSSLVLKMCFHDVQFTRCITSQLIKWFSNFREFFYIQMEKFARHALLEGSADVRSLSVGRESELFRALNMHYNKANDFQVPDRFLEVAEITLREFFIAISMGKDRDPSWKKAIYKVICKLDSDVPAEFKRHHSG
nr:prospero homeobox protein 1-like [Labrus bergylta]